MRTNDGTTSAHSMTASKVSQSFGMPDDSPSPPPAPQASRAAVVRSYYRVRFLLGSAAAVAAMLFLLGGRLVGIPYYPGFEASLVYQPSPSVALVTTGLLILVTTSIGTVIAGTVRFDAGLFAAAVGLSVFT